LDAAVGEKHVGADRKCLGQLLHQAGKGRIDLAIGAGGEDFDLPSNGLR
jgi:hypothetical protein